MVFLMNGVVRYVVATLLAVVGGYIGYHMPVEPFGVAGNVLFVAALFGLFSGLLDVTGFFGNVVNAFVFTFVVYFVPGWFVLPWFWGNLGYAVGNVFGQLARLSIKVGVRSI